MEEYRKGAGTANPDNFSKAGAELWRLQSEGKCWAFLRADGSGQRRQKALGKMATWDMLVAAGYGPPWPSASRLDRDSLGNRKPLEAGPLGSGASHADSRSHA